MELRELFARFRVPATIVPLDRHLPMARRVSTAIAAGASVIVAAGGDGTVSSVAHELAGTKTPLGVLPMGTLNHFARDLGIPFELPQAVATIAARQVVTIDAGEVNGRVFVNNSSIGIYPDIVVEREKLRKQGHRKWTAFLLATAKITHRYRGVLARITREGTTRTIPTPFLFVGNNEYEIDGINLGARRRLDAGLLSAYVAPRLHARELPVLVLLALAGRARRSERLTCVSARELDVDAPGRGHLRVAVDGEVVVMQAPLRFRIRPAVLSVVAPARRRPVRA
jgi:diacylglycerol kinase family enzyme